MLAIGRANKKENALNSMSANALPISLVVLAHNEASNIRRCLESARSLVTEIVVVVNDCTDGTDNIARDEFGATVYAESWHGHRDQKNIALQKSTQPWVLCLDCDEELTPELRDEIHRFVTEDDPAHNGASFPRRNWFLGRWIKHGDWYPDRNTRVARRGNAIWKGSREHDVLIVDGKVKRLRCDLLHYSHPTMNRQIEKINYFADIFLQRKLDAGAKFRLSQALVRPIWRFFRAYILRGGFLDGYPGYYIALTNAFSALVRHTRMYEHAKSSEPSSSSR